MEVGVVKVLDDVLFMLEKGKVLGIVGELGLGKFVMVFLLMNLIDVLGCVMGGEIIFNGENLW